MTQQKPQSEAMSQKTCKSCNTGGLTSCSFIRRGVLIVMALLALSILSLTAYLFYLKSLV